MRALAAWQLCLVACSHYALGVALQPSGSDATPPPPKLEKADLHKEKVLLPHPTAFIEFAPKIGVGATGAEEDKLPSFPPAPVADDLVFPRFKSEASASSMQTVTMDTAAESSTGSAVDMGAEATSGSGTSGGEEMGEGAKLVNALRQLNLDISAASQQVILEEKWIKEVTEVMATYMKKVANVKNSIKENKETIKAKLVKKRQVENIMLQKQLEQRLNEANEDLTTLNSAMQAVAKKQQSFASNEAEVKNFIKRASVQLDKLKGKASGAAAGASGGAAGGSSGAPATAL